MMIFASPLGFGFVFPPLGLLLPPGAHVGVIFSQITS
jgi:hypothetical protein